MARDKGNRLNLCAKDYVVFDLETTGLSPETDEIIEISGIKVRNGIVAEDFSTLVNPGILIPYDATSVNGITDDMVKDAPVLRDALGKFLDFMGTDVLVGHNIHSFDTNFLYDGALKALGKKVQNDYVDTLIMAKSCLPQLRRHRLTDVAAHFGIETKGAHRALNDCVMNQQCYEKLKGIWENRQREVNLGQEAPVCAKCGSRMVKRKGMYGEFWGCTSFPTCRFTKKLV